MPSLAAFLQALPVAPARSHVCAVHVARHMTHPYTALPWLLSRYKAQKSFTEVLENSIVTLFCSVQLISQLTLLHSLDQVKHECLFSFGQDAALVHGSHHGLNRSKQLQAGCTLPPAQLAGVQTLKMQLY